MLNSINQLLSSSSDSTAVTTAKIAAAIGMSLIMGFIISICYLRTNKNALTRKSFAITLIMLPVILSVIILFVGSNVARAFSLAGTLSIIRFRSAPGDPRDIGFIFFATAAGLACGVGMYLGGLLFVLLLSIVMLLLDKFHYGGCGKAKSLKITIPEDLCYEDAFADVFPRFTKSHFLQKVKTTDLGSLFEVNYQVTLKRGVKEKDLIDELRCRNGNLSIMMAMQPDE